MCVHAYTHSLPFTTKKQIIFVDCKNMNDNHVLFGNLTPTHNVIVHDCVIYFSKDVMSPCVFSKLGNLATTGETV